MFVPDGGEGQRFTFFHEDEAGGVVAGLLGGAEGFHRFEQGEEEALEQAVCEVSAARKLARANLGPRLKEMTDMVAGKAMMCVHAHTLEAQPVEGMSRCWRCRASILEVEVVCKVCRASFCHGCVSNYSCIELG